MRNTLLAAGLFAAVCASLAVVDSKAAAEPLATVNKQPIEQSVLYEYMLKRFGSRSLLNLITAEVIRQEAEKQRIVVTDEDVEAAISRKRETIDRSAVETGADFEVMLFAQKKTIEMFRESERTLLMLTRIVEKGVNVTEEDVQEYYRAHLAEFKLREAMRVSYIRTDDRDQISEVRQNIIAGNITFEDAAKEYSNDPYTKEAGGKFDRWLQRGQTPFLQIAFTLLKDGDVSDILPFPGLGYYLIRRDRYVRDYQLDFDEIKDELKELLENDTRQRLAAVKQQELLKAAKIEFLIAWPAGSFRPPKPEGDEAPGAGGNG